MSTPTNPGTPQLDESIRISHLEPKGWHRKEARLPLLRPLG